MRLGQFLCNLKVGAGKGVWDAKEGKRKVGRTSKEVGMSALDFAGCDIYQSCEGEYRADSSSTVEVQVRALRSHTRGSGSSR